MEENNLNRLYALSKINRAYLDLLTHELLGKGKRMVVSIINSGNLRCFTLEDMEDYILDLIVYILSHYKSKTKTFEEYASYVMYKRLVSKMRDSYLSRAMVVGSLDEVTDDGIPVIELIEDKNNLHIPVDISLNEIRLKMCSPKNNDTYTGRTKKRVMMLLSAGYSSAEIKKILHLTEGSYRYIRSLINHMN